MVGKTLILSIFVVIIVISGLSVPTEVQSQVSVTSGYWHEPGTWNPPGVPGLGSNITINAGHTIAVRYVAVANSITNNGMIYHPDGHLSSDKRVNIALMIWTTAGFVNNGTILGYNGPGSAKRSKFGCPTSIFIAPGTTFTNNGTIRAGDGYLLRLKGLYPSPCTGGWVIVNPNWTAAPFPTFANPGMIRAGDAMAGGWGGSVLILNPGGFEGWPAFGGPFSAIGNTGSIQAGDGVSGSTFSGGNVILRATGPIIGSGGTSRAGGTLSHGMINSSYGYTITYSGPGTVVRGGNTVQMVATAPPPTTAITLTGLDLGAIYARRQNNPPQGFGGLVAILAGVTSLLGNPAGTAVLVAEAGTIMVPGAVLLNPGVTLGQITSPPLPAPPPPSQANGERVSPAGLCRGEYYDERILIRPMGMPPDTNIVHVPISGQASAGDTTQVWLEVLSNQLLSNPINLSASDSLGFPIADAMQTTLNDSVPISVVKFEMKIPDGTPIGTQNRLDIVAEYSGDVWTSDSLSVYVQVISTLLVIPAFDFHDFAVELEDTIVLPFRIRNECDDAAHVLIDTRDSEGWEVIIDFTEDDMDPWSEITYPVRVIPPSAAAYGVGDTVFIAAQKSLHPDDISEAWVIVETTETGVGEAPASPLRLMQQNIPNPFNPQTEIYFVLPVESLVHLTVYNMSGRLVKTLVNHETMRRGDHARIWDGEDQQGVPVPSGTYFCRLDTQDQSETIKMTLVK